MSETIKVAGHEYSIGKLGVVEQFHVARRIGPVLAVMGVSAAKLMEGGVPLVEDIMPIMPALVQMMAQMSDADVDYVLFTCMGAAKRLDGERWAPLTTGVVPQARLMYQDLDLPTMMRVVVEVVKDNLGSFMQGLGAEKPSPGP